MMTNKNTWIGAVQPLSVQPNERLPLLLGMALLALGIHNTGLKLTVARAAPAKTWFQTQQFDTALNGTKQIVISGRKAWVT